MNVAAIPQAYEPFAIEPKWQDAWRCANLFSTPEHDAGKTDAYVFVAPPFTSGEAHMGHVRSYSIGDANARFRRARGEAVLYSLGFDAFGLPAEIGAIERGLSPQEWVSDCSEQMRGQFDRLGFSFDWSRTFLTCEPDMYRWSQWLFVTLLEAGLIYRRDAHVDWCEKCRTVLASAQTDEGRCWRCHGELQLIRKAQWFLRLSVYNEENDRRVSDLSPMWNDAAIAAQRTLLGRIDGVEFEAAGMDGTSITLFTPFPDEIAAGSFVALSPRHPDIDHWLEDRDVRSRLDDFRDSGMRRDDRRAEDTPFVETGVTVHVSGVPHPLPIIISPSVDVRYGPTAVLGIPSMDRIDQAIADRMTVERAVAWHAKMRPLLKRPAVRYRASDFPISRQRAWGAPIPIIHCSACGEVPVPRGQLPVLLPSDLVISGEGNALAENPDFTSCKCPTCGEQARRETDTLDCHVDVFWIYMALAVPRDERGTALFEHTQLSRWLPVAQFIQGADTGGFVLDERMVAKALRDLDVIDFLPDGEPYGPTLMHEMVQLEGRKMSKHLGNVVTPEALIERVGADALRFAVLYAAAPSKRFSWDENVLSQGRAFLDRLWEFGEPRLRERSSNGDAEIETSTNLRRRLESWCDVATERITHNYEALEMHRATRNAMTLFARIEDFEQRILERGGELTERDHEAVRAALLRLLLLLAPITPHVTEELWSRAGGDSLIAEAPWPSLRAS